MQFEWDEAKAAANLAKHGVSFEDAAQVFFDPLLYDGLDDRFEYGEERWVAIGMASDTLLHVTYVERDEAVRIISARRATRKEREVYERA